MTTGRALLAIGSACALALTARALFGAPVPLWVSAVALSGYLGLVTVGVLVPSLEMFADIACRGPDEADGVALTFDDGPHPVHTRAVLDVLDRAGAKATFFVLGEKCERHPDVVREIVARGHLIGVHGHRHDRMLSFRSEKRVRGDVDAALDCVTAITGERPWLYRPAIGQTSPPIARAARGLGLSLVGWSVRGFDGVATLPESVVRRVVRRLHRGAIVMLHDAAERDDRTPVATRALPPILKAIRERGFSVVRLDSWVPRPDRSDNVNAQAP